MTNELEVKKLFSKIGNHFSHCLFLASNVDVALSISNPEKDLFINTSSLINTLKNSSYDKFIYMSTAGVYDGLIGKVDTNTKLDPKNPYCISKYASEQYLKHYYDKGVVSNYYILRLG